MGLYKELELYKNQNMQGIKKIQDVEYGSQVEIQNIKRQKDAQIENLIKQLQNKDGIFRDLETRKKREVQQLINDL